MKQKKHYTKQIIISFVLSIILLYICVTAVRLINFKKATPPKELSNVQLEILEDELNKTYPERNNILKKLPYKVVEADLEIEASSAIIVDITSGSIIYEKKADKIIPPASMAKIAVMYVIMQEIESGKISYSDVVPLNPSSWACNMPPRSSLMFLGKDQIVTVEELLTGLDVSSGNDAAYALAEYTVGSMDNFVKRMNEEMQKLGLENTHFVEASGYSEKNSTTAREMAMLAREYITRFPDTLSKFHSRLSFTYPQKHNLPEEDRNKPTAQDFSKGLPEKITMGITQQNTNVLLGKLSGCDGLKTGYIEESGYNLALTAKRDETRFLSVTMNGPGKNTKEGNAYREKDGTTLMEWAFASFASCKKTEAIHRYQIPVTSAKNQWVYLTPSYNFQGLTVPFIQGESAKDAADSIRVVVDFPRYIDGGTQVGKQYGSITYMLGNTKLESVALVADRTIEKSNIFIAAVDAISKLILANKDNKKR